MKLQPTVILASVVLAAVSFAYGQGAESDVDKAAKDTGHATKTAATARLATRVFHQP